MKDGTWCVIEHDSSCSLDDEWKLKALLNSFSPQEKSGKEKWRLMCLLALMGRKRRRRCHARRGRGFRRQEYSSIKVETSIV